MSDEKKNGKPLAGDYEVGYGKPPEEQQFKKGSPATRRVV